MYLKSIEVQGFKSFANKLKFEFHEGITGIVGPNGSGKSNVADAVRWVLGEQSARQLRSGSMQDVIFAGTESRKPLGFASVAITFDNTDHILDVSYDEVTVTRRLFRSGESEYLLNGTQVRLRDIQEIFYDTGIGQEGYSIIGQGQIDRILSAKSEERRELFDEAAGIVKFKKRKNAALRKLESEHQNLLRVTDILGELTSRIGPLKKQSEDAKKYLELRQTIRDLDINLFHIEEASADRELSSMNGKLSLARSQMQESQEEFDRTNIAYEAAMKTITELDEKIAQLDREQAKDAILRQQLLGQIDLLEEQLRSLDASAAQSEKRKQQIEEEIRSREEEVRGIEEMIDAEESEVQSVSEEELDATSALEEIDLAIAETVAAIEQAKREMIDVLESRVSVKGRGQRYDTMLEQMEIRKSEIGTRLVRMKEDESRFLETAKKAEEELQSLLLKNSELEKSEADYETQLNDIRTEMAGCHERLDDATTAYHRDSSRLESLKQVAENYDGYGAGIRRIMEQKKRNPGIRGVVADLIDVPKKYETAIETALGGSLRNIVTDNEATAKYLIEYLKANRFGRATFLPLTSMRGRTPANTAARNEEGVIGIAADLVSCSGEYEELKNYLLGRTYVIDTIDHAILIGRKYRHSLYMVTLQGESFSPGGSISGGAFRNEDHLLGRKREIGELTESTKAERTAIETLREEIENKKRARNQLRDAIAKTGEELQSVRLRCNTLEMEKKQTEEALMLTGIDMDALKKELSEIDAELLEIRSRNEGVSRSFHESMEKEEEVNRRAENLQIREAQQRAEREERVKTLENVHLKAVSLSQKREFREVSLLRLTGDIESLKDERAGIDLGIDASSEEKEERTRQIAEIRKTIGEADLKISADKQTREESDSKRRALKEENREFFAVRDGLQETIRHLDKEIFRIESQIGRFEEGREERKNYFFEEYNLTPSEVRKIVLPEERTDRNAIRREISARKEEVKKLGPVNVGAIDEYKEVAERHEFLKGQHEDLLKSEETLSGIIEELDEGMRRRFTETFAEIRVEFDKAFRELFGGGHGTIEIEPNEDLLTAGISIIAHPPGKKLQNMMQLSGGEKALTAIALLFAIQNMKPSPFCLLDEIEAALDESNVGHFAEFLHKLTKNTQFIIITHRRGTMTAADRLYGITMQEKGVSTLVSVNLIEEKLD
ncbi:MAG: chromosome segregation protein SMC [Lachnospiraceae bacterium]|nr:chromosome segregation protein SMC [Lachnospiraceae bacterium]